MEKRALRRRISGLILAMAPHERERRSLEIQERIIGLPEFRRARCVAAYVAMPFEVGTDRIMREALAQGKILSLPRTDWRSRRMDMIRVSDVESGLVPGGKGIMEPSGGPAVGPERMDFVLVPGRAFDRSCNRMGQGGGFYDAFLQGLRPDCVTCAAAFDVQILDAVPVEKHDIRVGMVVSESEICRVTSRA